MVSALHCYASVLASSTHSAFFLDAGCWPARRRKFFKLNTRQKVGNELRWCALLRLSHGNHWRSLGDSNPCFRREKALLTNRRKRSLSKSLESALVLARILPRLESLSSYAGPELRAELQSALAVFTVTAGCASEAGRCLNGVPLLVVTSRSSRFLLVNAPLTAAASRI